jgi:hypothetical protein
VITRPERSTHERLLPVVVLGLAMPCLAVAQTTTASPGKAAAASRSKVAAVPYGSNPAAGKTFVHDGITLYYEVYGQGEPLLMIHGNGGSIGTLAAQIAFFRSRYRVIAMDSRDQGKSGDSPDKITYEKMILRCDRPRRRGVSPLASGNCPGVEGRRLAASVVVSTDL